jgi:integrase
MNVSEALYHWADVQAIGLRPDTIHYHQELVAAILKRWPEHEQDLRAITEEQIETFAIQIGHFSATRYNAMIGVLKAITPAAVKLKRRRVLWKERHNTSQAEFENLLTEADKLKKSHAGLVIEFLAHTGLRIGSARKLRWSDVTENYILCPGAIMKNRKPCCVPLLPGMDDILKRIRAITRRSMFVLPRPGVRKGISIACTRAGLPRLTHHDFRHLFTTRCIEAGVDIPTTARWRGDSDGGAMLVKGYFHLADQHSRRMARLVSIGPPNPVPVSL